ncbi:Hsp70 family protein [Mycobacterium sp. 1423905.2]|uniref:Hsp70 family protein n=1 Tax=Mycobacterium sp. 1423905.2 TaxID=1856859 RepID=UPI000800D4E3|nr:Hsp70 family protein [Mycobacterium sp. 1423905.2]OBJ62331.1 hypothetical protein A9W95_08290 [Mycobacterium sp. 1423905.2]
MAQGARPALGLSIGATNLAAVTADHAISRKPVLTLYRQRPPEVGVPSENPRLDEPGLVLTDFVDRVGDPVGIVAADGSVHRSEALVADALRALAYCATGGHPLPDYVAVTHPAHWRSAAVDALATALSRVSEWTHRSEPLTLIPDSAAALFAVRANPGIPARGIVAVCDFGGSGSSITLVDAAAEYQPVARPVRHHDFSGDSIDQALLTYVMSQVPNTGSFDPAGTSAIGSLARLRQDCRIAKERLSSSTVTTLLEDTPGRRLEIRLTRNELEDTIRDSLQSFLAVLEQTLSRNGIHGSSLAAIVSVGGGATIPLVTTTLSGRFGVPVVTTPRPQLTCAIGGALRAARGPADTSSTVLTPAAPAAGAPATATALAPLSPEPAVEAPLSAVEPALAWSEADDESRRLPAGTGLTSARPQLTFDEPPPEQPKPPPVLPWYRLPAVIIISTVVAVVLVGAAVAIGLSSSDQPAKSPKVSTVPNSSVAPSSAPSEGATPQPAQPSQAPETGQPAPPAPTTEPPPAPTTEAPPPPPPTSEAPPPTTAPPAPPSNTPPPAPQPPPVPQAPNPPPVPQVPQIPPIPGIGNIPGIPQVPGAGRISLPRIGPFGPR